MPAEVTTYVGRWAEVLEIRRLLGTTSLVTLIGPGGVGKTRLSLRVAAAARASFSDDIVYASLADLRDSELLVSTVSGQFGLGDRSSRPPIEQLVDHLRTRRLLLILDNCEHLIEECARLTEALLASCTDLVVLATSRQSLGVAGEQVLPVRPLSVPEPGESPKKLEQYDAVRLFVDRATAVVPSFRITDDNVEDVIRLCRALDGLPLTIELAAVWLRSLSVRQLADRLNKRFTLLSGGRRRGPKRQATFQAFIDWSHELCTEHEQLLWARASVFYGSFDLDAVEEVCSCEDLKRDLILPVLDGLVDKSILLREEDHGVARYRLLETVRQYGEDKLRGNGDLLRRKRLHRDWFLKLTTRFQAEWFGDNQVGWINRLVREHANLRGALDFCTSDPEDAAIGLRMMRAFKEYWVFRGLNTEGRVWLDKLLHAAPMESVDQAFALLTYAFLALVQNDTRAYETALEKADSVATKTGDEHATAYARHVRGYAALISNDHERSAVLFRSAAEKFRSHEDTNTALWATYNYGLALSLAGDLESGRQVLQDCYDTCVAHGEIFWRAWVLWSRSAAEYLVGDLQEAHNAAQEVLRIQPKLSDRVITAFTLTIMAGCATHSAQLRRGSRLGGAATTVWQRIGANPSSYASFSEPMQRANALLINGLGAEEAAKEFEAGTTFTTEQAVRYALDEQPLDTGKPVANAPDPLSKRESEIADLVSRGMTNREIAQRLVIARRTAETHVDHIMTKLGFTNRAQIAAWVVESRRS